MLIMINIKRDNLLVYDTIRYRQPNQENLATGLVVVELMQIRQFVIE